jgi:acyl-coenzyme A synthetase/AMP-(fatty) acid ligase
MYLDAKYHIRKDLSGLLNLRNSTSAVTNAATSNRASLLNFFLDTCERMPESEECIWSTEGSLTWREVKELACKYARFLREELGVQEGELVGFCLTNGVPYVVSLLATWAIGTAPAQLNYNLGGEGLIHCIKVSGCKVLLIDEDEEVIGRVEEVRAKVEELGVRIVVLNQERRSMIEQMQGLEMTQDLRKNVKITSTLMLIYTRYVVLDFHLGEAGSMCQNRSDELDSVVADASGEKPQPR